MLRVRVTLVHHFGREKGNRGGWRVQVLQGARVGAAGGEGEVAAGWPSRWQELGHWPQCRRPCICHAVHPACLQCAAPALPLQLLQQHGQPLKSRRPVQQV